jgi:LPXTG-motif cell wall-anchored protein
MKKTLAALALAGTIALIGAGPALAQYSPTAPAATVDDAAVAPGEAFIFSGSGMLPNEPVNVTVDLVAAPQALGANPAGSLAVASKINVVLAPQTFSTTANAQGQFSLPISLSASGTYSITATGAISKTTVGPVTVKVDPTFAEAGSGLANTGGAPLASTGAGLANTGADSGLVLWTLVGAGALAAGAASVVIVRRRAKTEAAA